MRTLSLTVVAMLASASTAFAAPAAVTVTVGPKLQKTFETTYGVREAETLTRELRVAVESSLATRPAYDGARVDLVLTDAKPNRPTFKQLGDKPGLSFESFGVGGAAIEGQVTAVDGSVKPVAYSWFESDIRQSYRTWTWHDATWTFDRFARKLARGEELARR